MVANAACWGTIYSFGTFLGSMTKEFDTGLGATALIFALPTFILFGLGLVTGPLADQYGPRRVVLVGAVCIGSGLLVTSRAPNLAVAVVAYGLGVGIGVGCFLVPVTACLGGWFLRRRALALGLSASGIGFGTILLVPVVQWMITTVGWRQAYVVLAVVCSASLVFAALVATRPPGSVPGGRLSPARVRRAAEGGPFLQLYVGGLLLSAGMYVPFVFLVRYAVDQGISKPSAALLLSVLGASNIVSRLALTSLAGRVGAVRMFLGCFLLLPVAFLVWLLAGGSYLALACFAAMLGVTHGGYVSLSPEVTAQLFGVANLGAVLGALWTASALSGLVTPVLAGVLIDAAGYRTTIAVALAAALGAVLVQVRLWAISGARRDRDRA
jgi:MFS family permease